MRRKLNRRAEQQNARSVVRRSGGTTWYVSGRRQTKNVSSGTASPVRAVCRAARRAAANGGMFGGLKVQNRVVGGGGTATRPALFVSSNVHSTRDACWPRFTPTARRHVRQRLQQPASVARQKAESGEKYAAAAAGAEAAASAGAGGVAAPPRRRCRRSVARRAAARCAADSSQRAHAHRTPSTCATSLAFCCCHPATARPRVRSLRVKARPARSSSRAHHVPPRQKKRINRRGAVHAARSRFNPPPKRQ